MLRTFSRRCSSSIRRLATEDPRMSKVVVHRGVVYLSGQTASDAGADVAAQTEGCLRKVDELLELAGTSKSRSLMATIWLRAAPGCLPDITSSCCQ